MIEPNTGDVAARLCAWSARYQNRETRLGRARTTVWTDTQWFQSGWYEV